MTTPVLAFDLEPDDAELLLEPEPVIASVEETTALVAALVPVDAQPAYPVVEVMPEGFKLGALVKFIPNREYREKADAAAAYALAVDVKEPDGLRLADVSTGALRACLTALDEHFSEPVDLANQLHKGLTSTRATWRQAADIALKTVSARIYTEQRRREDLAREEQRKAQEAADRQAREAAKREAEEAAKANAPAPVVEEMRRQAETASAPPVTLAPARPALSHSVPVSNWKARILNTPAGDAANPSIDALTDAQRTQVLALMKDIVEGRQPLACFELSWSYLNKRAKADKGTLAITGIEAFDEGGLRGKSARAK